MSTADKPEPAPVPNGGESIHELVIADIHLRMARGIAKHGTALQAHNGRDADMDAYQQALDLCVFLRQRIEEKAHPREVCARCGRSHGTTAWNATACHACGDALGFCASWVLPDKRNRLCPKCSPTNTR